MQQIDPKVDIRMMEDSEFLYALNGD